MLEGSRQTAAVAIRILGGEKAGDIKVAPIRFAAPMFDWRQMQRWGISESRLPPGSTVLFREPTVSDEYRWQIMLTAIALLLQTALIVGLLYEHRRRRTVEVEARLRLAQLAHLNRQTTAGELSASIAHELRQPLGAILSNTETVELMLELQAPNLEEIKLILADIKRADQRADGVIERLRRLFSKSAVETQDVDLNEIVGEVIGILAAQAAAHNVTMKTALIPDPLIVKGDRVQLEQVILNLVVNAIDALADAGTGYRRIKVRTRLVDENTAELRVSDKGPGIRPDVLKQIFEPFFTTKQGGMGMGLAISRTIVEAHGGQLSAENRAGGGANFRLTLPVQQHVRARASDQLSPIGISTVLLQARERARSCRGATTVPAASSSLDDTRSLNISGTGHLEIAHLRIEARNLIGRAGSSVTHLHRHHSVSLTRYVGIVRERSCNVKQYSCETRFPTLRWTYMGRIV